MVACLGGRSQPSGSGVYCYNRFLSSSASLYQVQEFKGHGQQTYTLRGMLVNIEDPTAYAFQIPSRMPAFGTVALAIMTASPLRRIHKARRFLCHLRCQKQAHRVVETTASETPTPNEPEPVTVDSERIREHSTEDAEPVGFPGRDRPGNAFRLGRRVFWKEFDQLLAALQQGPAFVKEFANTVQDVIGRKESKSNEPPKFVSLLTLDLEKVIEHEEARGVPDSAPVVWALFFVLCWTLDRIYEDRPIPKFWVLETVARLPYFSYITVLHLYESLGWWRTPQLRDIHNAEEHNELHHLLIMESLGGNSQWFDRFLAQHAALLYYWFVVLLFVVEPQMAYNFSLLVEEHAYTTYKQFVDENAEILKQVPPPPVAMSYYETGDLYYFDKFQTSGTGNLPRRRPPCNNLYDVFSNIRDDELEHALTMSACQKWWGGKGPSPLRQVEIDALGTRREWRRWAEEVANLDLHQH